MTRQINVLNYDQATLDRRLRDHVSFDHDGMHIWAGTVEDLPFVRALEYANGILPVALPLLRNGRGTVAVRYGVPLPPTMRRWDLEWEVREVLKGDRVSYLLTLYGSDDPNTPAVAQVKFDNISAYRRRNGCGTGRSPSHR